MQRKCHRCGTTFTPDPASRVYCDACEQQFSGVLTPKHKPRDTALVSDVKITPLPTRSPGRPKVRHTKERVNKVVNGYKKTCVICGQEFTSSREFAKTCGEDCRAEYNRRVARENYYKKKGIAEQKEEHVSVEPEIKAKYENNDLAKEVDTFNNAEVDMVNHPPHYKLDNGIETKDIIKNLLSPEEYRGWLRGNALKYQFRALKKGNPELDYQKARWFLDEYLKEGGPCVTNSSAIK